MLEELLGHDGNGTAVAERVGTAKHPAKEDRCPVGAEHQCLEGNVGIRVVSPQEKRQGLRIRGQAMTLVAWEYPSMKSFIGTCEEVIWTLISIDNLRQSQELLE